MIVGHRPTQDQLRHAADAGLSKEELLDFVISAEEMGVLNLLDLDDGRVIADYGLGLAVEQGDRPPFGLVIDPDATCLDFSEE